jgi:hypothetical protein
MKKHSVTFFANNVQDLKLDKTDKIIIFTTATTNEGSGYDTSTLLLGRQITMQTTIPAAPFRQL